MIRSILVAASGGESDTAVFETALAAARPLSAHLDFLHILPSLGDATLSTPHAGFAMGGGLVTTLDAVQAELTRRSKAAERHFREFCERRQLPVDNKPAPDRASASWHQVSGDALECLTFQTRHHDVLVMGRTTGPDGLPSDLLELVLLRSGRPVLIAPTDGSDLKGPAVVAWKESAEAARALAAALPLLHHAGQVVLVSVVEDKTAADEAKVGLRDTVRQLTWHGIAADTQLVTSDGRSVADVLASVAIARNAGLIVMGAYGHSRMREIVFGGCTQHFLRNAPVPVFLLH